MSVNNAFRIWLFTSNQVSLCDFFGKAWFSILVITRKRIAPDTATQTIQTKRAMFIGSFIQSLAIIQRWPQLIFLRNWKWSWLPWLSEWTERENSSRWSASCWNLNEGEGPSFFNLGPLERLFQKFLNPLHRFLRCETPWVARVFRLVAPGTSSEAVGSTCRVSAFRFPLPLEAISVRWSLRLYNRIQPLSTRQGTLFNTQDSKCHLLQEWLISYIRLPNHFCKNKNQSKRKENAVTKFRHRKALNSYDGFKVRVYFVEMTGLRNKEPWSFWGNKRGIPYHVWNLVKRNKGAM